MVRRYADRRHRRSFSVLGNLHTDDAGIIAGLILLSAAVVAFVFRKPGLIFGALTGVSILVSELWNYSSGVPRAHISSLRDFVLLLRFVTAISAVGSFAEFGL